MEFEKKQTKEKHKKLMEFEIQMFHWISIRIPEVDLIEKRKQLDI